MVDVFEEVEEELRSARLRTILTKGWPYALAAVVLALLVTAGIWGWREYQTRQSAKASESYAQAMDALGKGDTAGAEKAFAEVASLGPGAYKALAMMQQAGLRLRENKTAEAVAVFDKAAEAAPEPLIADMARLKAAYLLLDTASLADIEARLTPLAESGRPYVTLAREALAMKRLASGQAAQAKQALSVLAISPDASQGLQARAQVAQSVADAGEGRLLADIAKAAAALPRAQVEAARAQAEAQAQAQAQLQALQGGAQAPAQSAAPASQAGAAQ